MQINLDQNEITVLSDWLNKYIESDNFDKLDEPEKITLQNLDCELEKQNNEIFSENYEEQLKAAKKSVLA